MDISVLNSRGMNISVIIPTLNEGQYLEKTLNSIGRGAEVVVVDCGSTDSTLAVASSLADKVVLAEKGRGAQMGRGVKEASGDILIFLHADSRLPEGWQHMIKECLSNGTVAGGGFRLKIDSPRTLFRIIERMANLRSRYLGLIYGDQAIFVKRAFFLKSGGFMSLPLMEDVDLMRRLKRTGRIVLLNGEVLTSSRKWDKGGILKTTMRNWIILSLYYAGVSPERLYRWYYAAPA